MNDDDLLREFSTAFRTSSMFLPRRLVFLPPAEEGLLEGLEEEVEADEEGRASCLSLVLENRAERR